METKNGRVLDDSKSPMINSKRKRAIRYAAYLTNMAHTLSFIWHASPRCHKKLRSDNCNNSTEHHRKSALRNYSGFMKSGFPQKLMFYYNGNWKNYPLEITMSIKENFLKRKSITEIVFQDHTFFLDFFHMVEIDLKTGSKQPIAWIDEYGDCYFPELYSDYEEDTYYEEHESIEPNGTKEIHVQLQINVNRTNEMNQGKCGKTSPHDNDHLLICKDPVDKCSNDVTYKMDEEEVGESEPCIFPTSCYPSFESRLKTFNQLGASENDYKAVQKLFLMGLGTFIHDNDIIGIYRASLNSELVKTWLHPFKRQIQITKDHRGNANVSYGWFGTSKDSALRIMSYGPSKDVPKSKNIYGVGVHLAAHNCSNISASDSDADECGLHYMVLCRVIIGNTELVYHGSKQFCPSNDQFDSGLDSLSNPKVYVVWNMHVNTFIFPEYVVTFRLPPGCLVEQKSKSNLSAVSNNYCLQKVGDCGSSPALDNYYSVKQHSTVVKTAKVPTSPWTPFCTLLAVIAEKVPPQVMDSINVYYEQFKGKSICRDDLIKKLRKIVGDELLRSTIKDLHFKAPGLNISNDCH